MIVDYPADTSSLFKCIINFAAGAQLDEGASWVKTLLFPILSTIFKRYKAQIRLKSAWIRLYRSDSPKLNIGESLKS
jgi:hypothetical protein